MSENEKKRNETPETADTSSRMTESEIERMCIAHHAQKYGVTADRLKAWSKSNGVLDYTLEIDPKGTND